MFIRVDGHDIPIVSDDDLAQLSPEVRTKYRAVVQADVTDNSLSATLISDEIKAILHDVSGRIPPGVDLDFTLVRPPTSGPELAIPSLRPLRAVGRTDDTADALHQVRLFNVVGAVTVAGGHVEMAMRKVLVSLRGGENRHLAGDDIPAEWKNLHIALLKLCDSSSKKIATEIRELLEQAEAEGLRESRNDIIHGYWWLIPMDQKFLTLARYFHPKAKQPPANSYPRVEALRNFAQRLFEFAAGLEALVTPEWPIAIVPALGKWSPPANVLELQSRADGRDTTPGHLGGLSATMPKPSQKSTSKNNSRKPKRRKRR